jgi:hypothetical protein
MFSHCWRYNQDMKVFFAMVFQPMYWWMLPKKILETSGCWKYWMPIQTLINVEAILNHAQIYHKWVVTIKIMGGRLLFYQITANITPASTVASLSFRSDF